MKLVAFRRSPRRRPSLSAVAAAAAAAVLLSAGCTASTEPHSPATTRAPATTGGPATSSTTPPPTPTPTTPPARFLSFGDSGPAVLSLQRRLSALGYWLGTADGRFGYTTLQAVYALQKAAGLARDGVVGPATRGALDRRVVPHPRSTAGRVIEIDLGTDLLMLVDNGKLVAALNTSTGGGYVYVDQGVTAVARTPVGSFSIYRQVDGLVVSSLGELWRPKYFYSGYAIHGSPSVPPYPASHGCVRLSNAAIDWIWAADLAPTGSEVSVY